MLHGCCPHAPRDEQRRPGQQRQEDGADRNVQQMMEHHFSFRGGCASFFASSRNSARSTTWFSTIPTSNCSSDPLQNRSSICRTARTATLRGFSMPLYTNALPSSL